jgi:hypothetical protein
MQKEKEHVVDQLITNFEATMNSAITLSAAKCADKLADRYREKLKSKEYVDNERFIVIVRERLKKVIDMVEETVIEYMKEKILNAKLKPALDVIGTNSYLLSDVLKLAFIAILDVQACKDKSEAGTNNRIRTFYNTLSQLNDVFKVDPKGEGRCHTGIRNELIGMLMGVHPAADGVILSYRAEIEYVANDFFVEEFERLTDEARKQKIFEQWQEQGGEQFAEFLSSIKTKLQLRLEKHFEEKLSAKSEESTVINTAIANYIARLDVDAKLPTAIANKYAALELRSGLKPEGAYPNLPIKARDILVRSIHAMNGPNVATLSSASSSSSSSSLSSSSKTVSITNDTAQLILRVDNMLDGYARKFSRFLLDSNSHLSVVNAFEETYERFCDRINGSLIQISDEEIDNLYHLIDLSLDVQKRAVQVELADFFALWNSSDNEGKKQFFIKVLQAGNNIILSDQRLQSMLSTKSADGAVYLSPAEINQIFLSALFREWSPAFMEILKRVLTFVVSGDGFSNTGLCLQKSSYSADLVMSLFFLLRCKEEDIAKNITFMPSLILLGLDIGNTILSFTKQDFDKFINFFVARIGLTASEINEFSDDFAAVVEQNALLRYIFAQNSLVDHSTNVSADPDEQQLPVIHLQFSNDVERDAASHLLSCCMLLMVQDMCRGGAERVILTKDVFLGLCRSINEIYEYHLFDMIKMLFDARTLTVQNFMALCTNANCTTPFCLAVLQASIGLDQDNLTAVFNHKVWNNDLISILVILVQSSMMNQRNFRLVLDKLQNETQYDDVLQAIDALCKKHMLTQQLFEQICLYPEFAVNVAQACIILQGQGLFSQRNIILMSNHLHYVLGVSYLVLCLDEMAKSFVSKIRSRAQQVLSDLYNNAPCADPLVKFWQIFYDIETVPAYDKMLHTNKYVVIDAVFSNREYADDLFIAFELLRAADLYDNKNVHVLCQAIPHIKSIVGVLQIFGSAALNLFNQEDFSLVCKHAQCDHVVLTLQILYKVHPGLLLLNFHRVYANIKYNLSALFLVIYNTAPNLLTEDNINAVFGNAQNAGKIVNIVMLKDFADANAAGLIDHTVFKGLCENPQDLSKVLKKSSGYDAAKDGANVDAVGSNGLRDTLTFFAVGNLQKISKMSDVNEVVEKSSSSSSSMTR